LFVIIFITPFTANSQNCKVGFAGNYLISRTESFNTSWYNGINFGVPLRREYSKKWAIESGIFYNQYTINENNFMNCPLLPKEPNEVAELKLKNLQIPFLVDYNLGKGIRKLSTSINGGLAMSYYIKSNRKSEEFCQGNVIFSNSNSLAYVNRFKISLIVGVNLNYKLNEKYDLRLSYSKRNDFSSVTQANGESVVEMNSFGIGVLYNFFTKPELPELIKD
ncbi:MAG: PorT family protein, partial [Sphingobacteriales bacterium]